MNVPPSGRACACDDCGLCCLIRFEDEDTGDITPTRVSCKLFDAALCRCTDYTARSKRHVPDCIKLTPHNIDDMMWMPKSCAYRLRGGGVAAAVASADHRRPGKHAQGRRLGATANRLESTLADADDALDFAALTFSSIMAMIPTSPDKGEGACAPVFKA